MRLAFLLSNRSRKESWSLRGWVIAVAAISIGGALLTGALAGWYSWHEQKARLDQSMVATTRAIIQATDIELDQAVALARGLAIAPSLESGDISAYEKRSRALVEPFGYFFVLTDLGSSKELFNTAVPPGTGYPALPSEWMRSLENTQTPIVRPIFQGPADGMWTTVVQMTTSFAQGKNYVITLGVPYERFQRIIDEQRLPPEWSPVVIDQDWKIVARRPNPEFIGAEAANPHWIKQPSPDITYDGRELEGYETVNARSRSEKFGWTAAVAVPQSLLLQQFLGPAAFAALTGFVVCLVALGTIGLLASRLIRDVRVLSKAAAQLSERQVVQAGAMHITELKGVANEIQHASERLNAEEQFRKRAEFALRESEKKYRGLFESISDGFCIFEVIYDDHGGPVDIHWLEANPAYEKQSGLNDIVGKLASDVMPDTEDQWLEAYDRVIKTGKAATIENWHEPTNRWYRVFASLINGAQSRQVAAVFQDITDRKRREMNAAFLYEIGQDLSVLSAPDDIMQTVGERLGKFLHAAACFFADVDEEKNETTIHHGWNTAGVPSLKQTFRLADYFGDEFLLAGRAGETVIVSDTGHDARANAEAYAKLQLGAFVTVPFQREGRWTANITVTSREPRDWQTDEIGLVQEIASRVFPRIERARAEEALRESEKKAHVLVAELEEAGKNKNQFISVLSHEIRNPLAAISAGIEILDITQDISQTGKAKEIMKRQMSQLCKLVDDLLDLTRISQNKISLKKEHINLNRLVQSAVEDIRPRYVTKGLTLGAKILSHPIFLNADSVRIAQIIENVLSNALKFTHAKGVVCLTLKQEENNAVIIVQDNGIGISPELLPNLFTPFTQADHTLDRKNSGLGLGLSIVKAIAELHDGSVSAFSEGLGKGSTFTILLPLNQNGDTEQSERTSVEEKSNSLKILLIEDNRDFADILCSALTVLGHEVMTANDGMTGIAKAKDYLPDVIFCDIGLPKMDGFEVAERVRSEASIQNVYMVALTGYANQSDTEKVLESGFNKYLAKPIDIDTIRKILSEIGSI